ncbi:cell division protein FtsX [Patescibacteria group bacterium]
MPKLIKKIINSAWIGFSRNRELAMATIFIIALPIFLITWLFLFNLSFRFLISEIQEKVDISVYFKEMVLEEDVLKIQSQLSNISDVKNVEYISREKALEIFTERHEDSAVLMESLREVGNNPFLASLNIKAWQSSQYETIASFLEEPEFLSLIEKVDYYQRKPVIDRIFSLTSGINTIGLVLSLILALVAVLVAFNTIRMAIYNSRKEIKVMSLVGASNWFIRGPFLAQGIIAGIFATFVNILIAFFVCLLLSPKLEILFPGLNLFGYFMGYFWVLLLIQLAAGIGLGTVSSLLAIRKYLEV